MQAQFEDMFKQMSAATGADDKAAGPSSDGDGSAPKAEAPAGEPSFQETIRRTMERMQSSGDQATAAAASGGGDDFMAEMLKQFSSGDFNAEGGEEEFSKMLMGMMEQLTNKDILYEPMKELNEKFPEWLEKNKATTPAEDLKRYEEQRAVVAEIVAKFEEKTYADTNAADREYIVDRMQKMQAAGSPPPDLVGDMPSAQEAFNGPDEQCNPQ
ncbi:Pex19 protein [Stachybotrys elegans]|uniref:Pex19 protein n=1 Tax=Stachybotrys elegans TaxID=80388 RepID=A0A8K0T4W6_9HYPO|nr:Pex19 protein [Stachybotrys elegans]